MEAGSPPVRETVEFARIVAFTDGVFAIAITLLVLSIETPSSLALLYDFDRRLMTLNLAYLSLVVLVPFPTSLLGDYGDRTDVVVLYAAVVGSAALLSWLIIRTAMAGGHIAPELRPRAARKAIGILRPAIVFYASIPIALLSPAAGQLAWLALLLQPPRR